MNNEIKEILYLEDYINKYKSDEKSIINGNRLTTPAMLDYLEVKALLDYITNLQEENKRLNSKIKLLEHNCKQAEDSCRQHRLANKNKKRRIQRREEQINLYKQRINKAIEYIEDDLTLTDGFMICEDRAKELLDILKGEDK